MLAASIESAEDLAKLEFPVLVSPKLDGFRCLTDANGTPYTRKGLPFENSKVDEIFKEAGVFSHLDGELGVGDPTDPKFFTKSSSACRRDGFEPEEGFTYYIFDLVDAVMPYNKRLKFIATDPIKPTKRLKCVIVPQHLCYGVEEVAKWEKHYQALGYEGVMVRGALDVKPYKHGRASVKSQELFKWKRFADTEGTIIDLIEGTVNNNEAKKDALGHTKRSSAKAGKVPSGRIGTLVVQSNQFEKPVRIGTGIGLDDELRKAMYKNPEKYIGRIVTFTYQEGSDYENARFPSFKGFRDDGA